MNCCQFCTNKGTDKRKILCEMQSTRNVLGGGEREEERVPTLQEKEQSQGGVLTCGRARQESSTHNQHDTMSQETGSSDMVPITHNEAQDLQRELPAFTQEEVAIQQPPEWANNRGSG